MSFFGKSKDKERGDQGGGGGGQKSQFYVEFLGWMECAGLRGRKYADPVVQELRRRQKKTDSPPKLTIQVTPKELRITQDFESSSSDLKRGKGKNSSAGGGGGGGIKKIKFPAIPARDVTYVMQASRPQDGRPDDIVACIYLGFMPRTQRWVHVHVYRFDEAATAATFARLMGGLVEANAQRVLQVERELADRGEIEDPRLASSDGLLSQRTGGTGGSGSGGAGSVYSEDGSPTFGSEDMEDDLRSMADVREFDSVANELKQKLKMGDGPLLLPPKDYDTISRARGNLKDINSRRCLNLTIVGEGRLADESVPGSTTAPRDRNGSGESGVDLASPTSEGEPPFQQRLASSTTTTTAAAAASQQGKQAQPVKSPGSAGSGSPQVGAPQENGFVYPPKVPRNVAPAPAPAIAPAGSLSPEQPRHARQSSQDSGKFGTSTSRTSLNSSHSGDGAVYAQVYRRSDSTGGGPYRPAGGSPGHGRSGSFEREAASRPGGDEEEDLFPPTDYDDSPVVVGGPSRPRVYPPPTAPRPFPSGSGLPGSGSSNPLLMRSLPANVLHGEMAGMPGGPAAQGRPREARGAASESEELPYNPLRTSVRGGNGFGNPDLAQEYKPHSAGYVQGGGPIRRINSYR